MDKEEQELTDLVVWVTGASSGIGEELSKLRVSLVLSARREHELERVKRKCLENSNLKGKDILILPLDLTDRSSHEVATKAVLQEFGRIDILVNNAGRAQYSSTVDTNLDIFKEFVELNYLGTVSLTKCVLPHMIERKQGKIIIVNSLAGVVSIPLSSGYCASKHALRDFFNSLRTELTKYPGIIVSNICPGLVRTNIVKNALAEEVIKNSNGENFHKMATNRCVRLMLIAMANDLKEVWIANKYFLLDAYLSQYIPTLAWSMNMKCFMWDLLIYHICKMENWTFSQFPKPFLVHDTSFFALNHRVFQKIKAQVKRALAVFRPLDRKVEHMETVILEE